MPSKEELPEMLRARQGREDGFRTPDADYFAALADRVVAKENGSDQSARVVDLNRSTRRWPIAVAAAVALLLCTWFVLSDSTPAANTELAATDQPTSEELLAEISPEAIEAYIGSELDEFSGELLYANPENE